MTPGYPLALSLAVSMAVLGSALPAQARQDDPSLFNRQARGELSEYGGARRVEQDLTQALKQSLSKKKAKNVILLIGDGMGDSEITVARNYARGAGGYFKGIDALPLTGQYTHYSLHKDSGLPDYVTDSAASATAWTTGVKSYNGAIGVDIHEQPHRNLLEPGQAQRQGHRQRLHRRAAGRHPRRPARPRHRSQVLRSRGHQQAVPEQCPGERRRRLDHRAVAEDPP